MAPVFQPNNQQGEMVKNLLAGAETALVDTAAIASCPPPCPHHPGVVASQVYLANSIGDVIGNQATHHAAIQRALGALSDKVQTLVTDHAVLKTKVAIYAGLSAAITSLIVSPIIVIATKAILN